MRRKLLLTVSLFVLALGMPAAAGAAENEEPVFSGPQPGEKLTGFKVQGVYDEQVGKELDFIAAAEGKPTLLVFMHKLTRPGAALMRTVTAYAAANEKHGARACIVWLADDRSAAQQYLARARKSLSLLAPVGISIDGGEGPGAYGLNRNVELTILIANENKVTANFALVQPSVNDAPKIAAALAKLIDQTPPTQEQLTKLAYPNEQMRRPEARGGDAAVDPTLANLLRAVIQKDLDDDAVKKAAAAVEAFVGDDQAKQRQVARIAGVIVERKYGTEAAQKVAQQWRKKYAPKKDE